MMIILGTRTLKIKLAIWKEWSCLEGPQSHMVSAITQELHSSAEALPLEC